jgi:hypothetical protein
MTELCAAAQVTRNDAWWRYMELEKGVYNFDEMDSWVAKVNSSTGTACAAGQNEPMLQHFILEGGNHLYTGKDSTAPTTREEVAAFTRFAVAIISHYAGMGILWEIYNEADIRDWSVKQYAALVISVGKAVRAKPAIASEVIIGPSVSSVDCGWVQSFKDAGALKYVDAVTVHSYCTGAPEQQRPYYDAMRKIVGPSVAIISGEWGWATCSVNGKPSNCDGGTMPDVVSESDQAMYVARQWLVNTLERIPVSIYYDYTNDGGTTPYDRTQCEMNYGITMEGYGAPKPAYHAAVTVQKFVGRRPFLAQLGDQTSNAMEYVLAFGAAGDGPPPVSVDVEAAGGAEVFAVWTLSTTGGTAQTTGSKDGAYCGGDALFTGMASDCSAKCKATAGCRGFVSYSTGSVHSDSNCQLTGSRCSPPRAISGCGINIRKTSEKCGVSGVGNHTGGDKNTPLRVSDPACDSAVAYTLPQSSTPPPVVFALPAGAVSTCYSVFDVLGKPLPEVCAVSGKVTVKATESPVYLVGKSAPGPAPPTPSTPTPAPPGPTPAYPTPAPPRPTPVRPTPSRPTPRPPPPAPISPNPFVCGADRCFQSDSLTPPGVTYKDSRCTSARTHEPACPGLGGEEWLALKSAWKLGGSTMTALEDTTLKKSELGSSELPAPSKREVTKGTVVALSTPAVPVDTYTHGYYLVALRQ